VKPWKHTTSGRAKPCLTRFNSATAVKPWKLGTELAKGHVKEGFNSATAVKPWKRGRRPTGGATAWRLQFGHGSEAVETASAASGCWS